MTMRNKRLVFSFTLLCLALLPIWASAAPGTPETFASPIHGGCYQAKLDQCKLHVDPFTIYVANGQKLVAFQIKANSKIVYDFRTDTDNKPAGDYTPSPVKLDFAITCGKTYTINLVGKDTGDASFVNLGQTNPMACPVGTYTVRAPVVRK